MACGRSEQSAGSVSFTHTRSSVVGSHVRASAWVLGMAGSLWGQSCVNHTHLPSAPQVRGEAHAAQDSAVVPDVQGRGVTGLVNPRPLCPQTAIPLESLLVSEPPPRLRTPVRTG